MSRRLLILITVAALSVVAFPTWAKTNSKDSISATVDVSTTTNLSNNTTLAPGEYKLVAEGNQAKFERNGKTVAEVPCTLKTLPAKAQQTEVTMNHNQLVEIQIAGKTQAIEFSSGGSTGN